MNCRRFKLLEATLFFFLVAASAHAQITITSRDMFNTIGLYYKAYANKTDVVVGGKIGTTGGPQVWDFTTGPTDDVYRFDYVATTDEGRASPFPKATFAERKTEQLDGSKAWLYLEQVPGEGRRVYGAHEVKINANEPVLVFTPAIIDFPETINYRDAWNTSMSYKTDFLTLDTAPDPDDPDSGGTISIPMIITENSNFVVDAYGILNLPGIGFGDALRVNELVEISVAVDLEGNGNFQNFATEYVRNLYWLRRDSGIAAQISSKHQNTPPPENFSTASQFIRMFETNHPQGGTPTGVVGITGLKISLGKDQVLLNWNKLTTATAYKVEYSATPAKADSWVSLGTTTSTFMLDAVPKGSPMRFYRVAAVSQ